MSELRSPGSVGSVAEESARLVAALTNSASPADLDAAAETGDLADPAPETGDLADAAPDAGDLADAAAESATSPCDWCPVCRAMQIVRELSPETLLRAADLVHFAATVMEEAAAKQTSPRQSATSRPRPSAPASDEVRP